MHLLLLLTVVSTAVARPQRHPAITACSSIATLDDCATGGKCDCSRIKDTNSEEYFQCVTNPNCERCWVTRTTARNSTTSGINFQTMKPGTYTITSNGTVLNVIVTQEVVTPTTSRVYVTTTKTVVVTILDATSTDAGVTAEAQSIAESTTTATTSRRVTKTTTIHPQATCPSFCDCSKIQDKDSEA